MSQRTREFIRRVRRMAKQRDPRATRPPLASGWVTSRLACGFVRIMKDGATKEFVQAYNVQAAVDSHAQVIVGAAVTQEANDKKHLVPLLNRVKVQMGLPPQGATADNGCFGEANVTHAQLQEIGLFVAPDRQKHGEKRPGTTGPPPPGTSVAEQIWHKRRTAEGQAVCKLRKAVVEPVFGRNVTLTENPPQEQVLRQMKRAVLTQKNFVDLRNRPC
jgi:hypothetical protein